MATYNLQGKYKAVITSAQLTQAKTGTDQVLLTLSLRGYYVEGRGLVECSNPTFPPEVYLPLTTATLGSDGKGWVAETLRSLGFDGDFFNLQPLVGKETDAVCKYDFNLAGEEVERWSILRPSGPRELPAVATKDVRRLNATFGNLFKPRPSEPIKPSRPAPSAEAPKGSKKGKAKANANANPSAQTEGENGIPF